ncbi:MAG: hypothetical protein HYZ85_00900 [Candidatus Omnitrophica bacterium]|nr:hypothetical protein [Candidatus Omnitrophota bacterium]
MRIYLSFKLGLVLTGVSLFCFISPVSYALYSDELGAVKVEELSPAVHAALSSYGLKKADFDRGVFETRWIKDKVSRSKGLFKSMTSEVYERRYRLKVELLPEPYATKVEVRALFQYRPDASRPTVSWRTDRPMASELELERQCFMKILNHLAEIKKKTESAKVLP